MIAYVASDVLTPVIAYVASDVITPVTAGTFQVR